MFVRLSSMQIDMQQSRNVTGGSPKVNLDAECHGIRPTTPWAIKWRYLCWNIITFS